jgi:hypothetical protein
MKHLKHPGTKLTIASVLLLGLLLFTPGARLDITFISRALLVVSALAALWFWLKKRAAPMQERSFGPRLRVLDKASLSPKCGLALVEMEGRKFLVAHGDGFAQIHEPTKNFLQLTKGPEATPSAEAFFGGLQ